MKIELCDDGTLWVEATADIDKVNRVFVENKESHYGDFFYPDVIYKWCTDCKEYDQDNHCCHRFSRVIAMTVKEVEDNHRWHDLIKDPSDLPFFYDNVLIFDGETYTTASRIPMVDDWVWENDYGIGEHKENVVAWKEIEPFEVEG